jgi:hypothetical protein
MSYEVSGHRYLDSLRAWLSAAVLSDSPDGFGAELGALPVDDWDRLGVDLEGIAESSDRLHRLLDELITVEPSAGELERRLVEIETELEHARAHWSSLVAMLRSHDLWMD